ncbi:MAG: glycoside hydrolase 5 family protein [Spirochaetota bacterium]
MITIKLLIAASLVTSLHAVNPFVQTRGMDLVRNGKKYTFMGANLWYGMNLGAFDRPRLRRELDRLQRLGIKNLRILAASEGPDSERWRIVPALQTAPGVYNQKLLEGLDYLLAEMAKRDMTAVLVLGNYWHWSGGFGQYQAWAGKGAIPYPEFDPEARGGSDYKLSSWWRWFRYNYYVTRFYKNPVAVGFYHNTVRMLVTRINSVTRRAYKDDPTIMAWQLANEPAGFLSGDSYDKWIAESAALIKSLDRNHLVSTGAMGEVFQFSGNDQVKNHSHKDVDYTTVHIWVQNSGLYNPWKASETYTKAVEVLHKQLTQHRELAKKLGKPLVFEEFGFSRDMNRFAAGTPVTLRDDFYAQAFYHVLESQKTDSPIAGVNIWAWGGEGRPAHNEWKPGDNFIGDPPHEAQGWYSVYDTDMSTLKLIREVAGRLK